MLVAMGRMQDVFLFLKAFAFCAIFTPCSDNKIAYSTSFLIVYKKVDINAKKINESSMLPVMSNI